VVPDVMMWVNAKGMSVIAGQGSHPYGAGMASAILKLLMLFALALMPIGMAKANDIAVNVSGIASGHCDDHQAPAKAPGKTQTHCATCAALPAIEAPVPQLGLLPKLPAFTTAVKYLSDTEPEIVTPPPRRS
jgi:hypothetical protein